MPGRVRVARDRDGKEREPAEVRAGDLGPPEHALTDLVRGDRERDQTDGEAATREGGRAVAVGRRVHTHVPGDQLDPASVSRPPAADVRAADLARVALQREVVLRLDVERQV